MRRRIAALLLVVALGVAAPACGGDDDAGTDTTTEETTTGETTTTEETTTEESAAEGRTIFVESCGSCHTLADAGTSGTIGPSLDGAGLGADEIETQVREGGGGMPAFQDVLSDDEIESVAAYVAETSGG